MTDTTIIGIGLAIFALTTLAALQYGYAAFGNWYDRDKAEELNRRRDANHQAREEGQPAPERDADAISHDHPEDLITPETSGVS